MLDKWLSKHRRYITPLIIPFIGWSNSTCLVTVFGYLPRLYTVMVHGVCFLLLVLTRARM